MRKPTWSNYFQLVPFFDIAPIASSWDLRVWVGASFLRPAGILAALAHVWSAKSAALHSGFSRGLTMVKTMPTRTIPQTIPKATIYLFSSTTSQTIIHYIWSINVYNPLSILSVCAFDINGSLPSFCRGLSAQSFFRSSAKLRSLRMENRMRSLNIVLRLHTFLSIIDRSINLQLLCTMWLPGGGSTEVGDPRGGNCGRWGLRLEKPRSRHG